MKHRGGSYGRTTITVPSQLKRRMRVARAYVNWSAVACAAFEAKLAELENQEEAQTVQDVVERLRRLKREQTGSDSYRAGESAGRQWAMNLAMPDELERLEAFRGRLSQAEWDALFHSEAGWRELARQIHPAARPKVLGGRGREKAFWRRIVDQRDISDMDFFRGFAEGALAVWREVKDQL